MVQLYGLIEHNDVSNLSKSSPLQLPQYHGSVYEAVLHIFLSGHLNGACIFSLMSVMVCIFMTNKCNLEFNQFLGFSDKEQ